MFLVLTFGSAPKVAESKPNQSSYENSETEHEDVTESHHLI